MKKKFSEIKIGDYVIFNGQIAKKKDSKTLFIEKFGADGFHFMEENEEVVVIYESNKTAN